MIEDNSRQNRHFSRRVFAVGGFKALFFALLAGRLGWLQLVQGEQYRNRAENNRINMILLPPERGDILDRFGVPLALSTINYRAVLIPEQVKDVAATLDQIRNEIGLDDARRKRIIDDIKNSPRFMPIEIRSQLTWEEVARLEVLHHRFPGVSITADKRRTYPLQEPTAHVIGYVGAIAKGEKEREQAANPDPLLSMPQYKIGKSAIEKTYERDLRGSVGRRAVEVNVVGREVRQLKETKPTKGKQLTLTLDASLQQIVQERLSEHRSASAVILDVHTGEVLSLVSHPSFDPNIFVDGLSAENWETLTSDPANPLNNKAIVGQYPPGSTFKMVTALAGLESGVINARSAEFCPGHYDFGNHRFHCWKKNGHGTVNVVQALAGSCDTFFYKICNQIGIDKIAETARRLGLGDRLGFDLSEEKPGLVPDRAWKKRRMNAGWQMGETIISSIGQGYMLATPLQLATMTARLVNGGYAVSPHLLLEMDGKKPAKPKAPKLEIAPEHLEIIKQGMDAVLKPGGTAYGSRISTPGMEMGGKTGTSQVKRISAAERASGIRRQEDMPWHLRHHGLFVGYAPMHAPKYACAVIVEHGGGGSSAAAPVGRDILFAAQQRLDAANAPATAQELEVRQTAGEPAAGEQE